MLHRPDLVCHRVQHVEDHGSKVTGDVVVVRIGVGERDHVRLVRDVCGPVHAIPANSNSERVAHSRTDICEVVL